MEMLPYQDMVSNIVSHMIQQLRVSFMMLILLDEDSLDADILKEIKSSAGNMQWWMDPKFLTYSATKLKELGIQDPKQAFSIVQANVTNQVSTSLQAIGQVLALADRLVNSSPNELGQPNPREVAAREVQEISTSVQSIYSFYNEGPREQRAALKKMLYESLVCCGVDEFEVPVMRRYQKSTIEAAGFKLANPSPYKDTKILPEFVRIMGSVRNLSFNYYFDSRDGAERVINTQGAQVLQQFLVGLLQIPGAAEKLGARRLFAMLNTIGRMSGAPEEFQIQLDDGEDEMIAGEAAPAEIPPEMQQQIQALIAQVQQVAAGNAQLAAVVQQIGQKIGFVPQAAPPTAPAGAGAPPAAPTNGGALLQNPT
jgi:hypothetical protein